MLAFLDFTTILFFLGFVGLVLNKRNFLLMLLSLELTFLASALNFIFAGFFLNIFLGSLYGILIILVVVADTAIGLSLVVLCYRSSTVSTASALISLRG